jgi:DNA polymerase-3 subunit gamma/tau
MSDVDPSLEGPPWEEDAPDADAVERDPDTDDMFGSPEPAGMREAEAAAAPEPAPAEKKAAPKKAAELPAEAGPAAHADDGSAYTVLARKYRPHTFEDLIGQEAMVRTLTNAFATGRIAHAFMLTGVRGVGKTTTARLLARALNNETDSIDRPSLALTDQGRHDASIMAGQHMDVVEMDAASHTGIDGIRDIIESVRYAPVEARYKVYVLDEVHMLSNQAFNALLKTLEEPPPHAKFIFATTEIRKVPVTILSRCQRFDLRRVEPEILVEHLARIADREGMKIEQDALALIARAAEGSVRDGLSLLDQALVQGDRGETVKTEVVRDMLGLADRSQTIALFESIMAGRTPEALELFRTLYGYGADPVQVTNDLLEHCHAASVAKMLGPQATRLPNDQAQKLTALGAVISAGTLARVWQMLLRALDEVRRAPNPADAVEMAIVRLAYAADLPGPEEALKALRDGEPMPGGSAPRGPSGGGGGGGASAQLAARPVAAPSAARPPVVRTGRRPDRREARGRPADGRPALCPSGRLQARRHHLRKPRRGADRSGAQAGGAAQGLDRPHLADRRQRPGRRRDHDRGRPSQTRRTRAEIEADPFVVAVMQAFPGAVIGEIKTLAPPVELPAIPDESPDLDD